jgi:hypothetical protein
MIIFMVHKKIMLEGEGEKKPVFGLFLSSFQLVNDKFHKSDTFLWSA